MRSNRLFLLAVVLAPSLASADDGYKVEPLKDAPPSALAAPIREALEPRGYRVRNAEGKPFAEIWLRKGVPASAKPAGAQGAVQFPFLAPGELLGALRYVAEGQDYRDQAIPAGAYTLRYGLQPVNGDHLGVSTFRDYALLSPAAKDTALTAVPQKTLEERSAASAGTSHPAVLMLLAGPSPAPSGATMAHDDALNTWAAVLPLGLTVRGESGILNVPVQLVVSGAKMD